MLDKLLASLFSMRFMTIGLLLFLLGIGTATFIESIYGIQSAKIIIYNATWFEILLVYLGLNLISNIFKYKMFQREKIAMLLFHLSFIVILFGAAITRYISFEGLMVIKEGTTSDFIYTSEPHLLVHMQDLATGKTKTEAHKCYLSEITDNDFAYNTDFSKKNIAVSFVDFQPKMIDSLVVRQSFKETSLELITDGMTSNFLAENDFFMVGMVPLSFGPVPKSPGMQVRIKGDSIQIKTAVPLTFLPMSLMKKARQNGEEVPDSMFTTVPLNQWVEFKTTTLYHCGDQQFVFKRALKHAKKFLMPSGKKNVGSDYLTVRVSDGKASKIIQLEGGMGAIPTPARFAMNNVMYQLEYGSIRKPIDFQVLCKDFKLDKYPGSESPSSFSSDLTIIDQKRKVKKDRKVFMNNVMDYDGYRFFQSSYELDNPATPENEEGTKLSVNHDWWGTNITYLGYLLMSIGMLMSLFAPVGRFRELNDRMKKLKAKRSSLMSLMLALGFISIQATNFAQEHVHNANPVANIYRVMTEEHSEKLASLLVQDYEGRISPMHTLCDQLLRKIHRSNRYKNYNAVQTIMSIQMYPQYWINQKIVQVPSNLRAPLKLGEYASVMDLVDAKTQQFKWLKEYKIAHQRLESQRNEFDKKLIKLNEKFEVIQGIIMWKYLRVVPKKGDANHTWFIPFQVDTAASLQVLSYISLIDEGAKKHNFSKAESVLKKIKWHQRKVSASVVPSEKAVKMEISYNKMEIFKHSYQMLLTLGFLLLIVSFIGIFRSAKSRFVQVQKWINRVMITLLLVVFVYLASGLAMRWYISGHAPWSNGYEAVVFIAWVTMIAGFSFTRKNIVILAGTAILASLMIFVTELSLFDPEITPLVPVLKSYWLKIHVAIITGSYGFLGLAAILGFLNLILYTVRNERNKVIVTININELTYVSEMTMTIGLFMLTIGTFLGGIWANESWGRYWGWDPKETWALVSVLVYAVILHLRFIPKLSGKFVFNVMSFWGYSAILFTFFGVNFMLVGLHSYANGDGLGKFPAWLTLTILFFVLFTVIAGIRNYKMEQKNKKDLLSE
ncbi:MAG: cytochrome c biogenesis protein CcsA [Crocinitomicaceae bacterium]|jgi:cytochrome c-type biogenesis protein CcsB|nr:cytochrome c biogenesis protein CcsA [Crocinitomicaceae bacterium]MDP4761985.1 cytochrome c biogenesis protein CcsA [Crocinitomicaceae bacterium]